MNGMYVVTENFKNSDTNKRESELMDIMIQMIYGLWQKNQKECDIHKEDQ